MQQTTRSRKGVLKNVVLSFAVLLMFFVCVIVLVHTFLLVPYDPSSITSSYVSYISGDTIYVSFGEDSTMTLVRATATGDAGIVSSYKIEGTIMKPIFGNLYFTNTTIPIPFSGAGEGTTVDAKLTCKYANGYRATNMAQIGEVGREMLFFGRVGLGMMNNVLIIAPDMPKNVYNVLDKLGYAPT